MVYSAGATIPPTPTKLPHAKHTRTWGAAAHVNPAQISRPAFSGCAPLGASLSMAVTASPPPPARVADPDQSPGGSRARAVARLDLLLVGGLVALALVVRWPNLLLVPQLPSIGGTVLAALDLADGRAFPLYDQAPYLGGLMVYLLAAIFALFGPSVEATMLVPWVVGGLTAVPTYLLGRELGGRAAGLLAGALLATSGAHTVITSHVPLSHSLTPLLAATTLWLLVRADARGRA